MQLAGQTRARGAVKQKQTKRWFYTLKLTLAVKTSNGDLTADQIYYNERNLSRNDFQLGNTNFSIFMDCPVQRVQSFPSV